MDDSRFDGLARALAVPGARRAFARALAAGALGVAVAGRSPGPAGAARCKKVQKKCRKADECCGSLTCGKPTNRQTCNSTVDGVRKWCCVEPGGKCDECDCCGDFYCGGNGKCIRNPEG